jgi:glycine/D-amino acid oxidase-like deaminating enzyme
MVRSKAADVVVVGAGLVGMTAAALLAAEGLRVVVERTPRPVTSPRRSAWTTRLAGIPGGQPDRTNSRGDRAQDRHVAFRRVG